LRNNLWLFWLLFSFNLNGNLVGLSLASLVGVALAGTLGVPVASTSWVESSISNHDSEVSHSNSLEDEKNESDDVSPDGAVVTVDDHKDDGN